MAISRNLNIMLVDDNKAQITQTKEILTKTGFKNVNFSFSAKEALESVENAEQTEEKTQLIICSDDLKESTGIDLYKDIQGKVSRKVPFVLLASNSDQERIVLAAKNGIKNILLRPFSHQALINELAKILK